MRDRKFIFPAIILAAALGGAGAATLPAQHAWAQAATEAPPPPPHPGQRPRGERPNYVEGRIAFLKAELKITPAQAAQFDKVAQVMRENTAERRKTFEQMRGDGNRSQSALQHLETGARLAAMHAQQSDRLLAAFRPLYDSMSPTQRKVADDLMARHIHGGHRRI